VGALGDARFRRLLAGNSISSFGDSALYLSLGIWAKDLTASNAAAGQVFLALGLGYLTAPVGGQLADRFHRRPLLITANAATGVIVLSLLFVRSRDQLWVIYAVALAYGAGSSVIGAAGAGLVKELLPDSDLAGANAATQTIAQGLRLVSPVVGAGLYTWLGGGSLALLDAATFAVAIGALASVRILEGPVSTTDERTTPTRMIDGVVHLRRVTVLAHMTLAYSVAMLVLGFYESVTFAVIAALHRPASFFGVLMSVQAAGSIAGGLTATRLLARFGEQRTLGIALTIWAAATAIFTVPALVAAVVALAVFGLAVPLGAVAVATANQRYTPSSLVGRVSAASNMILITSQTISIAVGSALVDTVGYEPLLVAAAVVIALPAAALLFRLTTASLGTRAS
jgi:MFS family permease